MNRNTTPRKRQNPGFIENGSRTQTDSVFNT